MFWVSLTNVFLLAWLVPLTYKLYYKIKYEDDGRFFVTRLEFAAIHVHMSWYAAWILINLVQRVFVSLSFSEIFDGDTQTFFNWPNSHWSILACWIIFAIGFISLASYKDVFFACVLIYSYMAIFFEQTLSKNCMLYGSQWSDTVGWLALSMAVVLLGAVIITFYRFYNVIFYRKHSM